MNREQCFHLIASLRSVVVAEIDEAGRAIKLNEGFCKLAGIDSEGSTGLHIAGFLIQPPFAELIARPLNDEQPIYEGLLAIGDPSVEAHSLLARIWRTAQGLLVIAEHDSDALAQMSRQLLQLNDDYAKSQFELTKTNLMLRQREQEMASYLQQLTELKESLERQVKERTRELRVFSESIAQLGEAVCITDQHGLVTYVNRSFTRLTGFSAQEVQGEKLNVLNSGFQDGQYYHDLWQTIRGGGTWHRRIINKRKDGTLYPALLTISPLSDSSGEITHYIGLQSDLTSHEHLEKQFQHAQRMEAIGTLVGGMAHDFNNTLAGISGNLYLLKMVLGDHPSAQQRLDDIEALTMRAAEMIRQLMAFARKEAQSMVPLNVTAFVHESLRLGSVAIPANIRVNTSIPDFPLYIMGEVNLLQQALFNLLNNARDALEGRAGARINVTLSQLRADQELHERHPELKGENFACITVEDNGPGIAAEHLQKVFEPFFTTKAAGKGTGLGLAMSYGAIQSHQGAMVAESEPGKGTLFRIYLPLIDEATLVLAEESEQAIIKGRGETILLVDDELSLVVTGKQVLESMGYKVIAGHHGMEAVDLYRQHRQQIDLVILDVVMPRMGGVDAAQAIRRMDLQAKILFTTGYDKSSAEAINPDTLISKPVNVFQLSHVVRRMLDDEHGVASPLHSE